MSYEMRAKTGGGSATGGGNVDDTAACKSTITGALYPDGVQK